MGLLERLQRRAGRDEATTEVIAYVFMFAIGATALVFAMDVLTETQRKGNEIAASKQAEQLGQLTGSLVEQAARVAQTAPNASYETTFDLPDPVGGHNMSVEVTRTEREGYANPADGCRYQAMVHVHSDRDYISTSFTLGNVSSLEIGGECLEFRGEIDTSAEAGMVRYDRSAETSAKPVIFLEPTSKVR